MNIWFVFMSVCLSLWVLCKYIYVGATEKFSDSLELELHVVVSCSVWVLGSTLLFLEEQQALNCEPYFEPPYHSILFVYKMATDLFLPCSLGSEKKKCFCQSISHTVEKWIWKHYYWMTRNNLKFKLLTQTYIVFKYVNSYFCQRKLGQWKK